jgi:hypothetical protein
MNKFLIITGLLIAFIILVAIKLLNIFYVIPSIYFNVISILCAIYLIFAVFFH